jgi:hypothetical protein
MTSNLASIIKAKISKFDSLGYFLCLKTARDIEWTNIKASKLATLKKPFFILKKGVTGRTNNNYLGKRPN